MRVYPAVILGLAFFAPGTALAQEGCSCRPFPFQPDPPCFEECVKIIAERADIEELQETLGLSDEAVAGIAADRASGVAEVSQETIDSLVNQMRGADEYRVQDLLETESEIFLDRGERSGMENGRTHHESLQNEGAPDDE